TDGYLSSTDWNTFNNKGSGTVTGSGTATQVAFWSTSSELAGSSSLYWDSINNRLGVGTSNPQEALDVSGFIQSGSIVVDQDSLFINSNQSPNVGMGTNSPSERLDVGGVVKSTGLKVNSNTIYVADSGTNVGIGTSTPNQKFHIYGNSTYSNLFTVTNTAVGINTQSPNRNGGLHIVDSGIKISNFYGDMFFGQLYNHTDLRLASTSAKFYVSNGSSGPGGPGDTNLAPILVGQIGVKETSPTVAIDAGNATDAIKLPNGTTAQRPTAAAGMIRYNTTDGTFEGYISSWEALGSTEPAPSTVNQNGGSALQYWSGTQAQYDALTPDANTIYFIT
ncbi:MAG: hypothetical protein K0U52_00245, partial [Gammaproteobacteria bacterium]|nr:hypothetical protein [Gammaproteobacteria bacterium]